MAKIDTKSNGTYPKIFCMAKEYGARDFIKSSNPVTPTIEILFSMYTVATKEVPIIIALGTVFFGFFTMLDGVLPHSSPINPQKVSNVAAEMDDEFKDKSSKKLEQLRRDESRNAKNITGKVNKGISLMADNTTSTLPENLTPSKFNDIIKKTTATSNESISKVDKPPVITER
jgi:hypothetical protein